MKKLTSLLCTAALAASSLAAQSPKYIFYFIGDGMGHGQVMGADAYRRLVEKQQDKILMLQFPVAGMATTYSANTPVTDSAAAGTALATCRKTKNNMLGMSPDSVAISSLGDWLADLGYGIGLATNVCPDDATPAAFYAHVAGRGQFHDIARQFGDSKVKFLAGSRLRGTKTDGKYNGIYEELTGKGIEIVRGAENMAAAKSDRVLLLNSDTISTNLGFTVDGPTGNTLGQFVDAGIAHLQRTSPDRFFFMVEGGNIDWAGHDNDGVTIVREVLAYNDVLLKAYNFYLSHPDETLIVVTADHETGGMTIGQKSTGYNQYPQYVDRQHCSKARFSEFCWDIIHNKKPITWEEMKTRLETQLGFFTESKLSERQEQRLKEAFDRTFITHEGKAEENLYSSYPEFAEVAYRIQNEMAGYGFTSGKHTGNPVPVYAIGVGAENFGKPLDNTDIPRIIMRLATEK